MSAARDSATLSVTVSGSFRRAPDLLRAEWEALQACGCRMLSPRSVEFVCEQDGFVKAAHERDEAPSVIQQRHLAAMQQADFVWLHCPDGYVGASAAMEIGFAHALGRRVFACTAPQDGTLAALVELVDSPAHAAQVAATVDGDAPGRGLAALQRYYRRVCWRRGWEGEDAAKCLELLAGEVEELAEAVELGDLPAGRLEAADVQLYVIHLANIMAWDLGRAVSDKERINHGRFPILDGR